MVRQALLPACGAVAFALALTAAPHAAPPPGPIKLARHPDYHAGRITFSYMGDIWTAGEDGKNTYRLTDNLAREVYPRFSPDGRFIAFSSNRYGNYDVFVVAATGGAPRRLTYHTGNDDVVGWTRDSAEVVFRAARGDGAFPNVAVLYQVGVTGGQEKPLGVDWGFWGSYAPNGKEIVFNRHPAVWSRLHYRGAYAADLWIGALAEGTFRPLLADERYNRYWPMWGADNQIYFVADPLPNERDAAPGSAAVRQSVNNIYRVAATGPGRPVQVTRHTSGSLFWPSMSSDGKVIVYEENFGLRKLDVATGKSTEIPLEIATDDKENELEVVTVANEVNAFDLSPSGQRAVISARGQILTIATNRGDITRVAPDDLASRNQFPKWSPDGQMLAFLSDRSGRDEIWTSTPDGTELKRVSNLDNEKGGFLWTPDSKALLYTAADKKLYSYQVADAVTSTIASSDVARIGAFAVSPDSKWVALTKQDRTLRPHVYIAPIGGGEERHVSDDALLYSENSPVWTADGRYLVFTSVEGASNGIASQGGIPTTMSIWSLPLRDQERDPANRDIDSEAQAIAAEAAGRQGGGGRGGATPAEPATVTIDWSGLARRARQLDVPGDTMSGLTPAPLGAAVAVNVSSTAAFGGRGGAAAAGTAGRYIVNAESGQLTRVQAPPEGGGGRGGAGAGAPGGSAMAFARDGRTLYFQAGDRLFAAALGAGVADATANAGGRGGRGAAADAPAPAAGTARPVTYTANLQIDHKALRAQVFNEGWRIMKNRFYDAAMHGVDWSVARERYGQLLDYLVDEEELQAVMMMMIGQLNASHTGVTGGPPDVEPSPAQTRHPGFTVVADPSGRYRVGHIFKTGPADKDYLKVREGDYVVAVDGHDLTTADNYWRYFTLSSGQKFHFLLNDKPSTDGAWDVTIAPVTATAFLDLQYERWVADRRDLVAKLTNGTIGYLHIRAMDAPSLRQFQLDLAANRTKEALVIDQRFNGGGGIDQELLAILAGRKYQYTLNREATVEQTRPQNFYGPMVVLQNERSASNAEMFPAAFRALGLGKVIGVTTMGAVIGTGSYTLLDGSAIRTPGSGVFTATGQNMENYGVPPDVYVDNTPGDFLKGRDAQIEKGVEVLKSEIARRR